MALILCLLAGLTENSCTPLYRPLLCCWMKTWLSQLFRNRVDSMNDITGPVVFLIIGSNSWIQFGLDLTKYFLICQRFQLTPTLFNLYITRTYPLSKRCILLVSGGRVKEGAEENATRDAYRTIHPPHWTPLSINKWVKIPWGRRPWSAVHVHTWTVSQPCSPRAVAPLKYDTILIPSPPVFSEKKAALRVINLYVATAGLFLRFSLRFRFFIALMEARDNGESCWTCNGCVF